VIEAEEAEPTNQTKKPKDQVDTKKSIDAKRKQSPENSEEDPIDTAGVGRNPSKKNREEDGKKVKKDEKEEKVSKREGRRIM